jgi:hypothetical protein
VITWKLTASHWSGRLLQSARQCWTLLAWTENPRPVTLARAINLAFRLIKAESDLCPTSAHSKKATKTKLFIMVREGDPVCVLPPCERQWREVSYSARAGWLAGHLQLDAQLHVTCTLNLHSDKICTLTSGRVTLDLPALWCALGLSDLRFCVMQYNAWWLLLAPSPIVGRCQLCQLQYKVKH